MYCPHCGAQNADNAKFCAGCGAPLGGGQGAAAGAHAPRPVQQPAPTQAAQAGRPQAPRGAQRPGYAGQPASARSQTFSAATAQRAKSSKGPLIVVIIVALVIIAALLCYFLLFRGGGGGIGGSSVTYQLKAKNTSGAELSAFQVEDLSFQQNGDQLLVSSGDVQILMSSEGSDSRGGTVYSADLSSVFSMTYDDEEFSPYREIKLLVPDGFLNNNLEGMWMVTIEYQSSYTSSSLRYSTAWANFESDGKLTIGVSNEDGFDSSWSEDDGQTADFNWSTEGDTTDIDLGNSDVECTISCVR